MQRGQPSESWRSSHWAPGTSPPQLRARSPATGSRKSSPHRPPPLRTEPLANDGKASMAASILQFAGDRQPENPSTSTNSPLTALHTHASSSNLHHNFSRPSGGSRIVPSAVTSPILRTHMRKHSSTQGSFDSTLPSTTTSDLSNVNLPQSNQAAAAAAAASLGTFSTSQMAAKAAIKSHQGPSHFRQRSQTVPFPAESSEGPRQDSRGKVSLSPPLLSLTEASAPRENGFGSAGIAAANVPQFAEKQGGSQFSSAATAAANVVFPRLDHSSPTDKALLQSHFPLPQISSLPEKPLVKNEKSKVKLFSRPGKIGTSKVEVKYKGLPSPGKIGSALSALHRGNFSTSSLVDVQTPSIYSLNNSSSATIRPIDTAGEEKSKEKEKDKKHHFLARQKQKLKDDYHLALSSASSNSRPTDPNAPSSLYNFNVPASPGVGPPSFGKTKKDKKGAERLDPRLDSDFPFNHAGDRLNPGSWTASSGHYMHEAIDASKLGLQNHVSVDDAWPYLKAKLMVVFEGEDLRVPVEDLNRVVQMHVQWCIHKRSPNSLLEDLRDLLSTGFSFLDRTLRLTTDDRFLPTLVELWLFTFTSILPYMQSVFLPLDLEVAGCGSIMSAEQARDFWGGVLTTTPTAAPTGAAPAAAAGVKSKADVASQFTPAGSVLDVRRLVLTAYRDSIILPRYDMLESMFSRLSLKFLPSSFASVALASPPAEPVLSHSPSESCSSMARPGTAMSLDPTIGSFNSSTTLLGDNSSERGRSRAVSNVSFGSHVSDGMPRPFTPAGLRVLTSVRSRNVEDSKVTDMVGRMLQCMSVLASLGGVADEPDENNRKVVSLCKMLKLNWLGRGRTGGNRRGIVGGRVRRNGGREEVPAA